MHKQNEEHRIEATTFFVQSIYRISVIEVECDKKKRSTGAAIYNLGMRGNTEADREGE